MKKVIYGSLIAMVSAVLFMSCSEQMNMDYADIGDIRAGTFEDKVKWYEDNMDYVNEHQSETLEWLNKYGKIPSGN